MTETLIVGSKEHRDARKKEIAARINQAIEEISDEAVFTPDQIAKLNNVLVMLKWAMEELA